MAKKETQERTRFLLQLVLFIKNRQKRHIAQPGTAVKVTARHSFSLYGRCKPTKTNPTLSECHWVSAPLVTGVGPSRLHLSSPSNTKLLVFKPDKTKATNAAEAPGATVTGTPAS